MIVREHEHHFIMIQQHHHGLLAGTLMSEWKEDMFPENQWRKSVLTAISHHDRGWSPFDEQPFWNDEKSAPFRFTDFPLQPKIVLYRQGINEVEKMDAYAAMLCSLHYEQFIQTSEESEAQQFKEEEQSRRQRLRQSIEGFDEQLFEDHFALLQLGDNFSLYCCVNDPGSHKSDEHVFFRNGIPSPENFSELPTGRIGIRFADAQMIRVQDFPFKHRFSIEVKQKRVAKESIRKKGLYAAYAETEYEFVTLQFSPEDK